MKFSKNLKIYGVITVIVLLGAGYFYWSDIRHLFIVPPSSDTNEGVGEDEGWVKENLNPKDFQIISTTDPKWNLYRNFKYGFQIQYPVEFSNIKVFKFESEDKVFVGFGSQGDFSVLIQISGISSYSKIYKVNSSNDSLASEYRKKMAESLVVF